jgi:hypothetical protein
MGTLGRRSVTTLLPLENDGFCFRLARKARLA